MKTIFRYTNLAVLMAAILAFGAVAGFAQDPCADAEGQTKLGDEFRRLFDIKNDLKSRKLAIDTGKQFLEKYGSCDSTKELSDYLKGSLPKLEEKYKVAVEAQETEARYQKFNAAVKASNWDEVYAVGKEILVKEPDQVDLMITLGSIGYDELYAGRTNFKYNDDTIKFAKQSIASLEAGKTAKTYGLFGWAFKTKEKALAELNVTIGYLTQVAMKNKKDAAPYLFKATQNTTDTSKSPIPYELIGNYYFDETNKLNAQLVAMGADQKDDDLPEVAKQKADAIKAKVALSNGMAERAMDAFSRAYKFASEATPAGKAYKERMKKYVADAYNLRFRKTEGMDAWINAAVAKPFTNPTTPVEPIVDPEPAAAPATTTTSPAPAKPAPPATKPPATTTKPVPMPMTKPESGTKPQATVKKRVVKKKTT